MGVLGFLRAHIDSVVACLLAGAFVAAVALGSGPAAGETLLSGLDADQTMAVAADVVFLLSLALRTRLPLVPLITAYVALGLAGQGPLDASTILLAGLMLATYSVGAWAGGRTGLLGALGVGGLAGLSVLRIADGALLPREVALPVLLLVGPWGAGLVMRGMRAARGDERVAGDVDWSSASGSPDAIGRDDIVRQIRDIVERSMSAVILQARAARASLASEPARSLRALAVIEAAGTEALEETQRLAGSLLSPNGVPLPEPEPGLADVDYLAAQIGDAGLPVDLRVEGQPLPLTPDLDAVAYRVVHEALMSSLHHSTDAHASVVIRYERDALEVEVTDDGLSLEEDAAQETAGLMAVRDEVATLGGTLDAGPGDARGYWVLARLPYEPDWR